MGSKTLSMVLVVLALGGVVQADDLGVKEWRTEYDSVLFMRKDLNIYGPILLVLESNDTNKHNNLFQRGDSLVVDSIKLIPLGKTPSTLTVGFSTRVSGVEILTSPHEYGFCSGVETFETNPRIAITDGISWHSFSIECNTTCPLAPTCPPTDTLRAMIICHFYRKWLALPDQIYAEAYDTLIVEGFHNTVSVRPISARPGVFSVGGSGISVDVAGRKLSDNRRAKTPGVVVGAGKKVWWRRR